jgi:hypothetical protein
MADDKSRILCDIFKGNRKEGMYLYVSHAEGFDRVPQGLMDSFGTPLLVTRLMLTENKKLARSDAMKVIEDINSQGFYLQMPSVLFALDQGMAENNKLPRDS